MRPILLGKHRAIDAIGNWALIFSGALILYVLLIGPAARLYGSAPQPMQRILECVYHPVELVDQYVKLWPLHKYVEMWEP